MKKITILLALLLNAFYIFGQQPINGTLKIFSDYPVIVFVDQIQQPKYDEISLVGGTHYVKAINADEVKVYSKIVTIVANEVTTILIEGPAEVVATVTAISRDTVFDKDNEYKMPLTPVVKEPEPYQQTIDIGQVAGTLPLDMRGPYGLAFGMSSSQVDGIMTPKSAQAKKLRGYNQYAMYTANQSSIFLVECRFIDDKLFTVIVGYPTITTQKNKPKLDKTVVPITEFENMYNDLVAIYGEPTKVTKKYIDGYAENDGRLLEALKKKKALIVYEWIHPDTGNDIMLTVAYTTAPLAGVIYLSGPLGVEAQKRGLKLNSYDYSNTYEYNYFNK